MDLQDIGTTKVGGQFEGEMSKSRVYFQVSDFLGRREEDDKGGVCPDRKEGEKIPSPRKP